MINKNNGLSNLSLIVLVVISIGIVGFIFFIKTGSDTQDNNLEQAVSEVNQKSNQPTSSAKKIVNNVPVPTKEIVSQEEAKAKDTAISVPAVSQPADLSQVQSKINSLVEDLSSISASIKQNGISAIASRLDNYQNNLKNFINEFGKINLAAASSDSLEKLHVAEWGNYKIFQEVQAQVSSDAALSLKSSEIKNILDSHLKDQALSSLGQIVTKQTKTSLNKYKRFWDDTLLVFVSKIAEAAELNSVIHKKVKKGFSDLDLYNHSFFSNKYPDNHTNCWSYESWTDLGTGDLRQELGGFGSASLGVNGSDGKCYDALEVDITSGSTGKKLALAPLTKYAEWIKAPKIGIGSEAKSDPYTLFKNGLENGEWKIEGVDNILNGKNVYVLKGHEPHGAFAFKKPYDILYLDSVTYFPLKMISYMDKNMILGPGVPAESTKNNAVDIYNEIAKSWANKDMVSGDIYEFVVGEKIKRDSLPSNFFDLIIPAGYEIKDFTARG